MFQEMHLEEIRQMDTVNKKPVDTVSYIQILKEVKIAFPFVDTMSNGWIIMPKPNNSIDSLPIIFYRTKKSTTKSQSNQLYNFLRIRFAKDTVVLTHFAAILTVIGVVVGFHFFCFPVCVLQIFF